MDNGSWDSIRSAVETAAKEREAMRLPPGKTCVECRHYSRCAWLLNRSPESTTCDWFPSRFVEAVHFADRQENAGKPTTPDSDLLTGREYSALLRWLSVASAKAENRPVLTRGQVLDDEGKHYSVSSNGYVLYMVDVRLPALLGGAIVFKHSMRESIRDHYPDALSVYKKALKDITASATFSRNAMLTILRAAMASSKLTTWQGDKSVVMDILKTGDSDGNGDLLVTNSPNEDTQFRFRTEVASNSSFRTAVNASALYTALKYWYVSDPTVDLFIQMDVPPMGEIFSPMIFSAKQPNRPYTLTMVVMPAQIPGGI